MANISIDKNTLVFTVGISNCGKSFFCENHLVPSLKASGANVAYLSSDSIRRYLLGSDLHKHDARMLQVSNQAFRLLNTNLDLLTSYPVNADVVVVDATHLSKFSRKEIIELAKAKNYNLVCLLFDYSDTNDYFKYLSEGVDRNLLVTMLKQLRKETVKELERSEFQKTIKISSNDFSTLKIQYNNTTLGLVDYSLKNYLVIGDIHGCYDEFLNALRLNKSIEIIDGKINVVDKNKYYKFILVGDYIDKGPKIRETIEFIYNNLEHFLIVIGNHEYWVNLYMTGGLKKSDENDKLINSYFDTVKLLKKDKSLLDKFFHIYKNSYPYIRTYQAIITHAPCSNVYLQKDSNKALKAQRNFTYKKLADFDNIEDFRIARAEEFKFLINESQGNGVYHIFGHVMLPSVYTFKNKIGLDTGCVAGNALSTSYFDKTTSNYIRKIKSLQVKKEELNPLFYEKPINEVNLLALEPLVRRRVQFSALNKLNFLSGTMSPCNKTSEDIESLEEGLKYYISNGVENIILQPKYMGSRCNLFLHRDLTECKAFTRNGFLIKPSFIKGDLVGLFENLQKVYSFLLEENEWVLLDGELLPWNALGASLIDKDFYTPANAFSEEVKMLKESNFDNIISLLEEKYNSESLTDFQKNQKKKLENFKEKFYEPIDVLEKNSNELLKQINLYGGSSELDFKAFSILKVKKIDGDEVVMATSSNIEMFTKLCFESNYLVLENVQAPDFLKNNIDRITDFYNTLSYSEGYEGCVIKPEFSDGKLAPFLKCRNKNYLMLTYGPDYLDSRKYKFLIDKKYIENKIKTSINEWKLSLKLLEIKNEDISVENKEWVNLIVTLFKEQDSEKNLDKHL